MVSSTRRSRNKSYNPKFKSFNITQCKSTSVYLKKLHIFHRSSFRPPLLLPFPRFLESFPCTPAQVTYNGNKVFTRGRTGGNPTGSITLAPGETITAIFGGSGAIVDRVGFRTSFGRTFGPWGGTGGGIFDLSVPVVGFYGGRYNSAVSALGIYTIGPIPAITRPPSLVKSTMVGGDGAPKDRPWDDNPGFEGGPAPPPNFLSLSH